MEIHPVNKLGFGSAAGVVVFSAGFSITGILGFTKVLKFPLDPVLPDGSSLFLAWAFIVMMACVHYSRASRQSLWSQVGLAFAILYAGLVSIVYFVTLSVVVPLTLQGKADLVAPFAFDAGGSFMQALDGLGYFLMSVATAFAAPVFQGPGLEKWLRRAYLVNGVLGIPILLAYMPLVFPWSGALMPLGALWMLSVPAVGVLTAVYFRKCTQ